MKTRKYYSYKGEVGRIANNELNRSFKIDQPNKVWVTDVTGFKVGSNKLYLSPILDLYNLEIVSFSMSTRPTIKFTNRSLYEAINKTSKREDLIIHSDQRFHYPHHSWVKKLEENNITQSMSEKATVSIILQWRTSLRYQNKKCTMVMSLNI